MFKTERSGIVTLTEVNNFNIHIYITDIEHQIYLQLVLASLKIAHGKSITRDWRKVKGDWILKKIPPRINCTSNTFARFFRKRRHDTLNHSACNFYIGDKLLQYRSIPSRDSWSFVGDETSLTRRGINSAGVAQTRGVNAGVQTRVHIIKTTIIIKLLQAEKKMRKQCPDLVQIEKWFITDRLIYLSVRPL